MSRSKHPRRVVVIGGGISGLALAYYLARENRESPCCEITLLESSDRWGGIIQTEAREGFLLEAGPDAFLTEKPWALRLCQDLGLESELIGTNEAFRKSFIFQRGKLTPVPKGFYLVAPTDWFSLFQLSFLSLGGKCRMAFEPLIPRRREESDESVASFVRRRFGNEALQRIGQPMIGGIYMADLETLSLAATLPRFRELERRYGSLVTGLRKEKKLAAREASGPRYSLFVTLRSGMGGLISALLNKLDSVSLRLSSRVNRIERESAWKIYLADGSSLVADAICMALPAYAASDLLKPFADELSKDLETLSYESVATINLAFPKQAIRHPLDGFGFVVPAAEKKTIVACSFSSVKFQGRAPQDFVLLRTFVGGAFGREVLDWSDEAIQKSVLQELRQILGITEKPLFSVFHRYPHSMPQYRVGHLDRMGTLEARLKNHPGLFLTGNAYQGIGIPDCVHHASETAEAVHRYLKQETRIEV